MKELVCIVCPRGCRLKVDEENDCAVTGNHCPRGVEYGKNELLHPVRTVTSTVRISGALHSRCPVKTDRAIPKELVLKAVGLLDGVNLHSPVSRGQVAVSDILGTGANFIVTKDM